MTVGVRYAAPSQRWKRWAYRVAWLCLFALHLSVRAYHLDVAPPHNECGDEYTWTWSGMTFLQTGKPKGWSGLRAYKGRARNVGWRGYGYPIVEPWLDHPPLYSLYVGSWMLASGERRMFRVDLHQMRLSSLVLAAVSFSLLGAVLRGLTTAGGSLLALLFYAVTPAIVLHQRMVLSENLFVPLTLGCVLLLARQERRFRWWRWLAIVGVAALLPMTKVAALSASVFLVMWAMLRSPPNKRLLSGGAVALGTCLGVLAYWVYGHWLDGPLFEQVLANHRARFKGFGGMFAFLTRPRLVNVETKDLLLILSSLLALAGLGERPIKLWGLAVLVYVACMTFFVDQSHVYGWYFIPLYPWLCAALGAALARASRERHLGLSLLWCSVAVVIMVSCVSDHKLWDRNELRFAYLGLLLTLYGAWTASPRLAHATMPAINGLCVAGVVASCLYEVYLR